MKNILLITSLYPIFTADNKTTFVCHYFARDWVKLGYNVRVIHIQPEYSDIIKKIIFLKGKITNVKPLGGYIYEDSLSEVEHYVHDNVPIYRIPMKKFLPRNDFSTNEVIKLGKKIGEILDNENFVPDIITCHMLQWNIAPIINEQNSYNARICMVLHNSLSPKSYHKNIEWIQKYDKIGFRSSYMRKQFEAIGAEKINSFVCYSGIPADFITDCNPRSFTEKIDKFIYVGGLIQRKHPDKILIALHDTFRNEDFTLHIVGKGEMHDAIASLSLQLGLSENIELIGQQPRENILKLYDASDCMIMISQNEAYGLVYLEAMARGCITIASRNEGIDGVIIDGYNGYLCEAGNASELAKILKRIRNSKQEELLAISNNAIKTAKKYTDMLTAKLYIDNIK